MSGLSCLTILLACLGGLSNEANAAVLFPGDRQIAIPAPADGDVWDIDDRAGALLATQPMLLSLSTAPGDLVQALTTPHHDLTAVTWNSLFEVDQDARRFTLNLVLQEQAGYGPIQLSIGAVNLANGSPVMPLALSPSSVWLFVPALVGLLGVVLRERSCAASSRSETELAVEQRLSGHVPCLLVLSADSAFAHEIQEQVHRAGFTTRITADAHDALAVSEHASPALLLIDRRIADWDMLRTSPSLNCVPLIMLAPRGSLCTEDQWMSDLERGADGTHDFRDGSRLFLAKIGAYLRRAGYAVSSRAVYQVGAVQLDADQHEVTIAGQRLPLSAKPFAILQTLMQAPSKVFSRSELVDRVWGPQFAIGEHTLDVHVHALRRQLDRDPRRLCQLVTIKGIGFKLKAADSVPPSFTDTIDRTARPMAVNGTDGLRPTADFRPRSDGFTLRCQSPSPQVPVLKRGPRRRHGRLLQRPTAVGQFGRAALVG
jgi:two-component system response regulator RegX3